MVTKYILIVSIFMCYTKIAYAYYVFIMRKYILSSEESPWHLYLKSLKSNTHAHFTNYVTVMLSTHC
jgi:hypothetical protein